MVEVSALPVFSPWTSCLLINFIHHIKGFYFFSFYVLTFKEITWQTLRIEADATDNGDQDPVTTPMRLITNQGRIQIALKRRVSVFSVLTKHPFLFSQTALEFVFPPFCVLLAPEMPFERGGSAVRCCTESTIEGTCLPPLF